VVWHGLGRLPGRHSGRLREIRLREIRLREIRLREIRLREMA